MARVGEGFTFGRYDRMRPRVQRWRVGIQRELGANMLVEASYWGQYADRLFVTTRLDALPEQYWNATNARNNAIASNMNQQVTNPFHISNFDSLRTSDPTLYQHLSTLAQFTSPTIQKHRLLRPFPHMNGLNDSAANTGAARTHALELNFQRRLAQGFMLNASYTRMVQENRTFLDNEFESVPTIWYPSDTARPHRVTATGLYELPFGKGRAYLQDGILNHILGGWQVAVTYEFQPGPLLAWGNIFYNGNLDTFAEDVTANDQTLEQWFDTSLPFERVAANQPAAFQTRVFPRFFDGVRADGLNQWNAQRPAPDSPHAACPPRAPRRFHQPAESFSDESARSFAHVHQLRPHHQPDGIPESLHSGAGTIALLSVTDRGGLESLRVVMGFVAIPRSRS